MNKIRPAELDERLPDEAFLLDLRPLGEYQRDHIEGSRNAPVYDDLRNGDTEALDAHIDRIPDDAEIVTICKAGVVAEKATSHLREEGYDAATLAGGYKGWRHYEENTLVYRVASTLRTLVP